MTTLEAVINQDTVVVFAPPAEVEVITNVGPAGVRGSKIYVGAGEPSETTIPNYSLIRPDDMYININSGSPNYSWLYHYTQKTGGNTWQKAVRLNPALYNATYSVAFVAGEATINIPLELIAATDAVLTATNFSVDITIENDNPVAASIKTKSYAANTLTLVITAAEYSGGTWAAYAETPAKVNVSVSLVTGEVTA
jgi:hypothetical protein